MLLIAQKELDAIRKHAEQTYPIECCGVLLGVQQPGATQVYSAVPCSNARAQMKNLRYEIDACELVNLQRKGRESGLEIVGFYHSHPDHPANWSDTDLAEAHWIGSSYVIVSVRSGIAGDMKSFRLTGKLEEDKRFEQEEVRSGDLVARS